jgi:hypothetical protein
MLDPGCTACNPRAFDHRVSGVGVPGRAGLVRLKLVLATEHGEYDEQDVAIPADATPILEYCVSPRGSVRSWLFTLTSGLCSCDAGRGIANRIAERNATPTKEFPSMVVERFYTEIIGAEPPINSWTMAVNLHLALLEQAVAAWPDSVTSRRILAGRARKARFLR